MQSRLVCRSTKHQGMTPHQRIKSVVTTADHAGDWDLTTQTGIKHEMIALQKSHIGQAKPAQAIVSMRINSSVVEHQFGLEAIKEGRKRLTNRSHVGLILNAIFK